MVNVFTAFLYLTTLLSPYSKYHNSSDKILEFFVSTLRFFATIISIVSLSNVQNTPQAFPSLTVFHFSVIFVGNSALHFLHCLISNSNIFNYLIAFVNLAFIAAGFWRVSKKKSNTGQCPS